MSEEQSVGGGGGYVTVESGEWAGWSTWQGDPFEDNSGPFFERKAEDGERVSAFRAERRHMNGAGFMHGGCLLTFADSALFAIAKDALGGSMGVTLSLTGDFLDPAREGALMKARGRVVRAGGKTIFVEGQVTADEQPVLRFNGIIRKVGPRPAA